MLVIIESTDEKRLAQEALEASFKGALRSQGTRRIGFRVGSGETNPDMPLYSNGQGKLWCAFDIVEDVPTRRYWNAFGLFDPQRLAQEISVELNVPIDTNKQVVAGFFARDLETGRIYLLHSGRVEGGRKGISKSAFLAWSRQIRLPAVGGDGLERWGIVLGDPTNPAIVRKVDNYVRQVAAFKKSVIERTLDTSTFRGKLKALAKDIDTLDRFNSEFSGKKSGGRGRTIDYMSYHGDIVNALKDMRASTANANEKVFNTLLIDLYVKREQKIVEIYEVKTGTGRQAIYTAVGQLMIHSQGDNGIRKIIVLPAKEGLPGEVIEALAAIHIECLRFTINEDGSIMFRLA